MLLTQKPSQFLHNKHSGRGGLVGKDCGWISGWTLHQSNTVLRLEATDQGEALTLASGKHLLLTGSKEIVLVLSV